MKLKEKQAGSSLTFEGCCLVNRAQIR